MINSSYRDLSWDILRGILILLVVVGHAISDSLQRIGGGGSNVLFNAIYLFHMPLFIFVSGYFAHSMTRRSLGEIFKVKIKRLLFPWMIWSTFAMLIWVTSTDFLSLDFSSTSTYVILGKTLYRTYFQYLWFLPCVFFLTIGYFPIVKYRHDSRKLLIYSIVFLLIWTVCVAFNSRVPFNYIGYMQLSRQTIPFGLGLLYYFYKDRLNKKYRYLILSVATIGACIGFSYYGVWQNEYTLVEKIYSGTMLSVVMFAILKLFSDQIAGISIFRNLLGWCGQNSLGIYVIHMSWRTIFIRWWITDVSNNGMYSVELVSVYLALSVFVIFLMKKVFRNKSYILGI